jgi:hypothetical protein
VRLRVVSLFLRAVAWFLALAAIDLSVAEARSLHWSRLEVEAQLDANGVLGVIEKQSIVFDGAWNGGERWFANVGVMRLLGIDLWDTRTSHWMPLVPQSTISKKVSESIPSRSMALFFPSWPSRCRPRS